MSTDQSVMMFCSLELNAGKFDVRIAGKTACDTSLARAILERLVHKALYKIYSGTNCTCWPKRKNSIMIS